MPARLPWREWTEGRGAFNAEQTSQTRPSMSFMKRKKVSPQLRPCARPSAQPASRRLPSAGACGLRYQVRTPHCATQDGAFVTQPVAIRPDGRSGGPSWVPEAVRPGPVSRAGRTCRAPLRLWRHLPSVPAGPGALLAQLCR